MWSSTADKPAQFAIPPVASSLFHRDRIWRRINAGNLRAQLPAARATLSRFFSFTRGTSTNIATVAMPCLKLPDLVRPPPLACLPTRPVWALTDVKGRCISVLRHIEDNLRGEFMTRVHALVSPEFFDALALAFDKGVVIKGSVTSHRLLKDAVIVSDDAGQFNGKRSFKPWTGPTSGSSSTSNRGSTRGLVTRFALRYRRSHGGSRGRFRHRPDAGRG